jgi:pimeloyl-ACP methyl ester carboxylesterase
MDAAAAHAIFEGYFLNRKRQAHVWLDALRAPVRMHDAMIEGTRLRYCTWNADSEKPILLLSHGYRGHLHWWDWIAPFLTEYYRAVAFDFSGMGDSAWRSSYHLGTFVTDLLGIARFLSDEPLTAVAHSFGGNVLLRACAEAPSVFGQAVIIDSHIPFGVLPHNPRTVTPARRVFESSTGARDRFRLTPDQPVSCPGLLQHVAQHSVRETAGSWSWKFDPSLPLAPAEPDEFKALSRIRIPVSYLYGEQSCVVDRVLAQRIVEEIPTASGPLIIADGHHHLMFDHPAELLTGILRVLGHVPNLRKFD